PREQLVDLPDGDDRLPRLGEPVDQGRLGRLQREVAPPRRARVAARRAEEWTRDYPPHRVLALQQLARRAARGVELFDRNRLLVRGDLENTVGGSVHDESPGAPVLVAEPGDDLGSGRGQVADPAAADALAPPIDQ